MKIYIPTYQRVDRQVTWDHVPKAIRYRTFLVCPESEAQQHRDRGRNVIVQPDHIKTIGEKRPWIIQNAHEAGEKKLLMLDDDMWFYGRTPETGTALSKANATDLVIVDVFHEIEDLLNKYAHVGISARMGNNRIEADWKNTHRMMFAMAYDTEIFMREVIPNRVRFREDFDYTLQLLRKGYDNIVCFKICVAPAAFGTKGGCSEERTIEGSNEEAHKLAALHPGFVSVAKKEYGTLEHREETMIYWQKALASSKGKKDGSEDYSPQGLF